MKILILGAGEDKIIPEYESKTPSGYYDTAKSKSVLSTKIRDLFLRQVI